MEQWLPYVCGLKETQVVANPDLLAQLFTLDLSAPQVSSLQQSLSALSDDQVCGQVDDANVQPSFPRFSGVVKAYLLFCKYIVAQAPAECFDLYAKFFVSLQQVYTDQRGCCFNVVLRTTIREIWRWFRHASKDHLEWFAAGLLRLFNAVRSEREPLPANVPSKKSNVLFYACMISRAYFRSAQFVSAGNVFNNMHSVEIRFSQFSLSEQVEYRFWLGRYLLYQEDVCLSFTHLDWAYNHALSRSFQKQLCLDWLVVPSILVGRLPTEAVLQQLVPEAADICRQLVQWLKHGVLPADYTRTVRTNAWIAARSLAPTVLGRLPLLVYKRGLKKVHALLGGDNKLALDHAQSAFRLRADPQLVLTESICGALMSAAQLKGNVLPLSRTVVLKSTGCFPRALDANAQRRALPARDGWMSA